VTRQRHRFNLGGQRQANSENNHRGEEHGATAVDIGDSLPKSKVEAEPARAGRAINQGNSTMPSSSAIICGWAMFLALMNRKLTNCVMKTAVTLKANLAFRHQARVNGDNFYLGHRFFFLFPLWFLKSAERKKCHAKSPVERREWSGSFA
jgi:hypothetical protein